MNEKINYQLTKLEYEKLHHYAYQIHHHWEEMHEAQIMLYNLMKTIEEKNRFIGK